MKKMYKIGIETDNLEYITLMLNENDRVTIDSEELEKHASSKLKLKVVFKKII